MRDFRNKNHMIALLFFHCIAWRSAETTSFVNITSETCTSTSHGYSHLSEGGCREVFESNPAIYVDYLSEGSDSHTHGCFAMTNSYILGRRLEGTADISDTADSLDSDKADLSDYYYNNDMSGGSARTTSAPTGAPTYTIYFNCPLNLKCACIKIYSLR